MDTPPQYIHISRFTLLASLRLSLASFFAAFLLSASPAPVAASLRACAVTLSVSRPPVLNKHQFNSRLGAVREARGSVEEKRGEGGAVLLSTR
jgi:hypothetical protein